MVPETNDESEIGEDEPGGGEIGEEPDDIPAESGSVPYEVTSDDRTWGILAHASAFAGFVVPFGNILGPLLVWAIKKEDSQFVDDNGTQALNFQLTWTILLIVSALSIFVVIGFLLLPIVALAWLILVILAIVRASNDEVYDYPLTLDLIS